MSDFETGPVKSIRLIDCTTDCRGFYFSKKLLSEYDKFLSLRKRARIYLSSDTVLVYRLCNIYISELVEDVLSGKMALDDAVSEILEIYNRYAGIENLGKNIQNWIFDLYAVSGNLYRFSDLFENSTLDFPLKNDFLICEYFKEFFSSSSAQLQDKLFSFLPAICDYRYYEKTHFIANADVCYKVLYQALQELFEAVCTERGKGFFVPEKKKVLRSAFDGLYCKNSAFRLYELEYVPYSENTELNTLIDCAVKYTDNILRHSFGVQSKIVGIGLSKEYRTLICNTVREKFPFLNTTTGRVGRKPKHTAENKKTQREITEENRVRIHEFVMSVDFSKANTLERDSWGIATLFGDDYEGTMLEYTIGEKGVTSKKENESEVTKAEMQNIGEKYDYGDFSELFEVLSKVELGFLRCLVMGDNIGDYCRKYGKLPLGISSEINEKAIEYFGDTIICEDANKISLLCDYEKEISEIINKKV